MEVYFPWNSIEFFFSHGFYSWDFMEFFLVLPWKTFFMEFENIHCFHGILFAILNIAENSMESNFHGIVDL